MNLDELGSIDVRIFSGVTLFGGDLHLMIVSAILLARIINDQPYTWRQDRVARAAVGLFVYCFGMMLVRGWGVPLLILIKHGYPTVELENAFPVSLVGTMVAAWGIVCMARVFTPASWSWYGWALPLAGWLLVGALVTQL